MNTFRTLNLSFFLACMGLIATAYYMEYVMYLDPCPLCMVQRYIIILIATAGLAAVLQSPNRRGELVYCCVQVVLCMLGASVAGRHVWLQHAPADKIPECFPGIEMIFAHNRFFDALAIVFAGTGECAQVSWKFLGLSIPEWTLLVFIGFGLAASTQFTISKKRTQ